MCISGKRIHQLNTTVTQAAGLSCHGFWKLTSDVSCRGSYGSGSNTTPATVQLRLLAAIL